ncbi:hypothetical protein EZV62_013726 [Acer yangbiense]|uniref:Uncharacterized protein n=1 Tax=Acer yangbiense TaxID=1000413 RepID=A0A5C7HYV9_9ROSI|nr:hypothetical protein EZV62_013726 [Acer yangbiense]
MTAAFVNLGVRMPFTAAQLRELERVTLTVFLIRSHISCEDAIIDVAIVGMLADPKENENNWLRGSSTLRKSYYELARNLFAMALYILKFSASEALTGGSWLNYLLKGLWEIQHNLCICWTENLEI